MAEEGMSDPEWKHHPYHCPLCSRDPSNTGDPACLDCSSNSKTISQAAKFQTTANHMFRVWFHPLEFLPVPTLPSCLFRREESPPDVTWSICTGRFDSCCCQRGEPAPRTQPENATASMWSPNTSLSYQSMWNMSFSTEVPSWFLWRWMSYLLIFNCNSSEEGGTRTKTHNNIDNSIFLLN